MDKQETNIFLAERMGWEPDIHPGGNKHWHWKTIVRYEDEMPDFYNYDALRGFVQTLDHETQRLYYGRLMFWYGFKAIDSSPTERIKVLLEVLKHE